MAQRVCAIATRSRKAACSVKSDSIRTNATAANARVLLCEVKSNQAFNSWRRTWVKSRKLSGLIIRLILGQDAQKSVRVAIIAMRRHGHDAPVSLSGVIILAVEQRRRIGTSRSNGMRLPRFSSRSKATGHVSFVLR
jgi:hypothetical protein